LKMHTPQNPLPRGGVEFLDRLKVNSNLRKKLRLECFNKVTSIILKAFRLEQMGIQEWLGN